MGTKLSQNFSRDAAQYPLWLWPHIRWIFARNKQARSVIHIALWSCRERASFPRECCNATVDRPREHRFYAFPRLIAAHWGRVSPRPRATPFDERPCNFDVGVVYACQERPAKNDFRRIKMPRVSRGKLLSAARTFRRFSGEKKFPRKLNVCE